jgi:Flp pilus assembly protein TadG
VEAQEKKGSLRLAARFARLRTLIGAFRSSRRGNVAIITALCAIPLVSAVGCVVDYSMASLVKTKLQAAADAASLATVSFNSPVISTAQSMTGNGTISGGSTEAVDFFNANLTGVTGYTGLSSSATVSKSGQSLTATISFTAQVPTFFMGIVGYKDISVSGTSTASYNLPTYIDFYLMIDSSGSMGFPSTSGEQQRLEAVNPDNYGNYPTGCTFACHFQAQGACANSMQKYNTNGYCEGYNVTRTGTTTTAPYTNLNQTPVTSCPTAGTSSCIQLRADAVGYAVDQLLSTAASSELVANQFEVGLYPFIQYLPTSCSSFPPCFGLTSNLSGSASSPGTINYAAANLATVLDTGNNAALGSGGTHFENAFTSMNRLISSVGSGTSASSPLPYVFLITDGSQDYQTYWNGNWSAANGTGSWSPTAQVPYQNSATIIPPNSEDSTNYCTTLKNRGITIAVLYIPYETISPSNPNFASNEDGYANANIPNIPAALESCASPNFFYTATSPAEIDSALQLMFEQAVSTAHITD